MGCFGESFPFLRAEVRAGRKLPTCDRIPPTMLFMPSAPFKTVSCPTWANGSAAAATMAGMFSASCWEMTAS